MQILTLDIAQSKNGHDWFLQSIVNKDYTLFVLISYTEEKIHSFDKKINALAFAKEIDVQFIT